MTTSSLVVAAAVLAAAAPPRALASCPAGPTIVVNSTDDVVDANPGDCKCETAANNNVCTLRAAVMEANRTTGATIQVPSGTYLLSRGPGLCTNDDETCGNLNVNASMSIVGTGSTRPILDGSVLGDRILNVATGVSLELTRLVVQKGSPPDGAPGGCILADGDLTATDVRIFDCHADNGYGGGIGSVGALTLVRTVVTSCSAYSGGGIESVSTEMHESELSGNSAWFGGGLAIGATNFGASTRIVDSTISANTAFAGSGQGGGIFNDGHLHLTISTLSGNHAVGAGGGLFNDSFGSTADIRSSTIMLNIADSDDSGGERGGGIFNADATAGSVTILNSLLSKNRRATFLNSECNGTLTSLGYTLLNDNFDDTCTITGSWGYDPGYGTKIGPLQDNGGATKTHALLPNAVPIDAGNPSGCTDDLGATLTRDQRGVHRPIGAHCDIGAFEWGPKGDVNGDGTVNVADVFFLINYLFAGGALPPGVANVNGDSAITVADVFYLINYLFAGGPAPV
jgi:hypothetical protein